MPHLTYHATNFPTSAGPLLSGRHSPPIFWEDLVWAPIIAGKRGLSDLWKHGWYSLFEIEYRTYMVYANLMVHPTQNFTRTPVYRDLDPSEKSSVSYFLGLMTAKLLADRLLGAPWLMHFDRYRSAISVTLQGNQRPDLIGQSTRGGWTVVEAKGRTNRLEPAVLAAGKIQARAITSINGCTPLFRVSSLACFSRGMLQVHLDDPDDYESPVQYDVLLDEDAFLRAYYAPIRFLLDDSRVSLHERQAFGNIYVVKPVRPGIEVGLDQRIYSSLRREGRISLETVSAQTLHENGITVHSDGVFVAVGEEWSETMMRNAPYDRNVISRR